MKNVAFRPIFYRVNLIFFILLISWSFSFAAVVNWKGANGAVGVNWNRGSNWSTGTVPTNNDDVVIGNVSITQQPTISTGTSANCKSLTIGGTYTSVLTVSGSLSIGGDVIIKANGTLIQGSAISITSYNFSVQSGGIYTELGSASLTCLGNFDCSGTANQGTTSTITLTSFNPVISGTHPTFNNLALLWGTATVSGPLTINNRLSFLLPWCTLDLGTFPLTGTINSVVGWGAIKTQNTSSAPLPAGLTWPGPIYYNGAGNQTIVNGDYTNLDATGGNRTLSATGNINISGTFTAGTGSYTVAGSTVVFDGTSAQSIPACSFYDLKISNAAGVALSGTVRVINSLGFGNVNNSVITTNGYLTLASSSSNTANLLDITNAGLNTGNKINGNVIVERYIQGKRTYRFLTAPVNSTLSIKANWMENTNNPNSSVNNNPVPNYGTHISGIGGNTNGFDATVTNNPSLFTFNAATQAWVPAANTNTLITAGTPYRIMVRGSRGVNLNDNNATPSTTILRATGELVTGTVTMAKAGAGGTPGFPYLSATTGAYNFVANPYASGIDWKKLVITDIANDFYYYDPTISGSNGRGAYVCYNGILDINNNSSSNVDRYIQSGQAFFVQTTGPNPSITFDETDKKDKQNLLFRTTNDIPHINIQLLLPEQTGSIGSADGTAVYFSEDYSSAISADDSYKLSNQDENIAIFRDGKYLSIEGRKPVAGTDSIPLKLWQLTQKNYILKVTVANFADNVESYLQDKYLNKTIPVANGETLVPFSITSDAASRASDRFKVIFESFATLPVRLTGLRAYAKNKGVQVDWVAESESNMDLYEVQKSADAQNFKTIGSAKAINNPGISSAYNFFDANPTAGDNYYRIKSVEKSGEVKVSEVMRVQLADAKNVISVVNNPVLGNTIKLLFNNAEKGNYAVSLISISGEKIYSSNVAYAGGTVVQNLDIKTYLAPGVYELHIVNDTISKNLQVLVN